MKKTAKEIAIKLGIAIPTCVLSISALNAAESDTQKAPEQNDSQNEVISLLSPSQTLVDSQSSMMVHSDVHTNVGGNHVDRHSNSLHSDTHANHDAQNKSRVVTNSDGTASRVSYCEPHSDRHTNRNPIQSHTNSGNKSHTDRHSNRNYNYNCD